MKYLINWIRNSWIKIVLHTAFFEVVIAYSSAKWRGQHGENSDPLNFGRSSKAQGWAPLRFAVTFLHFFTKSWTPRFPVSRSQPWYRDAPIRKRFSFYERIEEAMWSEDRSPVQPQNRCAFGTSNLLIWDFFATTSSSITQWPHIKNNFARIRTSSDTHIISNLILRRQSTCAIQIA